jgi:hypothetical protein
MSKHVSKPPVVQTPQDLLQEICAPHILPDERAETFDALRQALFSDLAPATPYEHLLAEQLVALEWEALRHRRMRDSLLRAKCRELAVTAFDNREPHPILGFGLTEPDEEARHRAFDLVSQDPHRREAALAELSEREITVEELMAGAYQRLAKDLEPHERQIAEIESRRRKLREDYDGLRAKRAVPVEDAEEIGS